MLIGGPCLAIPGEVYAFYVLPAPPREGGGTGGSPAPARRRPAGMSGAAREIAVNLTALPGSATVQWINTWTGDRTEDKVDRPAVYQLNRPASFGDAPALLIVRSNR